MCCGSFSWPYRCYARLRRRVAHTAKKDATEGTLTGDQRAMNSLKIFAARSPVSFGLRSELREKQSFQKLLEVGSLLTKAGDYRKELARLRKW